MRNLLILFCVVTAAIVAWPSVSTVFAAPPEVRGTWMTTTDNIAIASPANTAEFMKRLREIGLNTVYVECWKDGYTEFPSATLQKTIGLTHKINLPGQPKDRDLMRETIIAAHRNQLLHIAWFEFGFMASYGETQNELRTKHPKWLLRDKNGSEVAPDGMVWMNPLHPEVRSFLLNIILDAALNYDMDGIQLDDHLAWPGNSMGYDDFTRAVYMNDHGGTPPPDDINDKEWVRWRAEKVTEFAGEFYNALRKARPDILISVSPSPYPSSYENHAIDWPLWVKNGWMDEFVPQLYRNNFAQLEKEWPVQVAQMGERKGDLIAGLRIVGDGPDTPWKDLKKMIELVRKTETGGHCWWFSRGVLESYPQQLTEFYNVAADGYAPHPKRPADWRPAPIVGEKRGRHWRLRVEKPGWYTIIAQKDGAWLEQRSIRSSGGSVEVPDDKYQAVELLVDRRGKR